MVTPMMAAGRGFGRSGLVACCGGLGPVAGWAGREACGGVFGRVGGGWSPVAGESAGRWFRSSVGGPGAWRRGSPWWVRRGCGAGPGTRGVRCSGPCRWWWGPGFWPLIRPITTQLKAGIWPTSSSSGPSFMAHMIDALQLKAGIRVLEIGAGTGYNAACMAEDIRKAPSVNEIEGILVARVSFLVSPSRDSTTAISTQFAPLALLRDALCRVSFSIASAILHIRSMDSFLLSASDRY